MKIPGTNAGSGCISRLRPRFADRRPRFPSVGLSNFQPRTSNIQNSNREANPLETGLTARKYWTEAESNREYDACSRCLVGSGVRYRPGVALGFDWGSVVSRATDTHTQCYSGTVVNPLPYGRTATSRREKRRKDRIRLPPKVSRLKRRPILYFVPLAGDFNRAMLRLEIAAGPGCQSSPRLQSNRFSQAK